MTTHVMRADTLQVAVHLAPKRDDGSTGLVRSHPWHVFDASDYKDQVPGHWLTVMGSMQAVFFFGIPSTELHWQDQGLTESQVTRDPSDMIRILVDARGFPMPREMWFDFNAMGHHSHNVAVLMGVQGLNAVSGLPTSSSMRRDLYVGPSKPVLEFYRNTCPRHGTPFADAHRFCTECGFRWDPQNFISDIERGAFWRDGWRGEDGKIQQFVLVPTSSGKGVAQQLIGERRSEGIDIAVFLSKHAKPQIRTSAFRGGFESSFEPQSLGGDGFRGLTRSIEPEGLLDHRPAIRRVGAPERMEVGAGRTVDQRVTLDPHDPDHWREEPEIIFTLIPLDLHSVIEMTRNGPTTREVRAGPFAGIQTA